jgi:signal peptidase II
VVALVVIVLDQLTKAWAVAALSDGPIQVVGTLRLLLVHNDGAAFSQGRGFGWLFGIAAVVVSGFLWARRDLFAGAWGQVGVGLVLGGALGNLIDRLVRGDRWLRGTVVDFIDLQWWPVFNVADIGVSVGVVLLVLTLGQTKAAHADG